MKQKKGQVVYKKKTDEPESETQTETPQKREQKPSRFDWDASKITLSTPYPQMPKSNEIIHKPDRTQHDKQMKELSRKIDQLYQQIKEERRAYFDKLQTDTTSGLPLKQKLQSLINIQKELKSEQSQQKEKLQEIQKKIDNNNAKLDGLKGKSKTIQSKEQIQKQLQQRQYTLSHESVSIQEEKKIVKEIEELQKQLVLAAPCEELIAANKKLQAEKKACQDINNVQQKKLKDINQDIQGLINEIEGNKGAKLSAELEAKHQSLQTSIEGLKDQRDKLYHAYQETWDKYNDQQEEIRHIEWTRRRIADLKKVEAQKKKEEEMLKEQEKENQLKQLEELECFKDEIALCNVLIRYCEGLLPKKHVETAPAKEDIKNEDLDKLLQKEKLEVIKPKNSADNDENHKKQKNKKATKGNKTLTLQVEMLRYFETVQCSPPATFDSLEATIKMLKDKKNQYETASQEERQKKLEAKNQAKATESTNVAKNIEIKQNEFPDLVK